MKSEEKVRIAMRSNISMYTSYVDGKYIVDDNSLARDVCNFMDDYEEDYSVPHRYFELAYSIAKEYEKQRNRT